MNREQWEKLAELFELARQRDPMERASFVEEACGGDLQLRQELESLLAEDENLGDFMELSGVKRGLLSDIPDQSKNETEATAPCAIAIPENDGRIGSLLQNRYFIERRLGGGGMGVVYLARDRQLHSRLVVIKILKDTAFDRAWLQKKFRGEIEALARINHPCVVGVSDVGTGPDGWPYFVMEFVEGHTLRSELKPEGMDFARAAPILRQVGQALEAAHSKGVCHLDLKPANIMVQDLGDGGVSVKLIDFGIAQIRNPQQSLHTDITKLAGTVEYMAPEQLQGKASTASDIYTMGVIAYEMLCGSRPFQPLSPFELLELQRAGISTRPSTLRRNLPKRAEAAVLKSLEFDAERRYQRASDFGDSLSHVLTSAAGSTRERNLSAVLDKRLRLASHQARWAYLAAAVILLLLGIGGYMLITGGEAIGSVAVLPLSNAGGDSDLDYLAEGLAESITNNLSQLSNLRVASHSSAILYKGREIDPPSVARELNVQAVLHGRVVKRSQGLLISLWLVDAKGNRQLWGEQYLRQVSDIVRLQSEISREVSEKLRLRLTGEEEQRFTRRPTINPEAYRLYLLARFHGNKRTEEGDLKSIEYFNQAVTKDPTYAAAYAGLAFSHVSLASNSRPPKEEIILARSYAAKALKLDEALDEGHYSMAAISLFYDWDWVAAESEIKRTLELNSNLAGAYSLRGHLLRALGRTVEAVEAYMRAWEVDPLSLSANYSLGLAYYFSDQYDKAIDQYQKTSELIPGTASVYGAMGLAYGQKGEFEKAIRFSEQAWNLSKGETTILGTLGQVYAAAGKRGEALRVLQDLIHPPQQKYVRPSEVATIYALLGQKQDAFIWLEKAFEERSPYLLMLRVDPMLMSLRSDPRFDNLLRRMKLP